VGNSLDVQQARGFVAFSRGAHAEAIRLFEPVYASNPYATIVQRFYGFSLGSLGEFDAVREIPNPFAHIFADIATKDFLASEQKILRLIEAIGIDEVLDIASLHYVSAENYNSLLNLVDEHYGGIDELLEKRPQLDNVDVGYMPNVAWAYLQEGRQDEYDKVVTAMRVALDYYEPDNSLFYPYIRSAADFHAVTGDVDEMVIYARRMVDLDGVNVSQFDLPYYHRFDDNEAFMQISDSFLQRANEERAKLGLGPYQPIAISQ
jgi:tetratricopeptide (TPR) repeat protein